MNKMFDNIEPEEDTINPPSVANLSMSLSSGSIMPIQNVAPGGNDSVELLETEQQCINEAIVRVSIR